MPTLSKELVARALPPHLRNSVSQHLVDTLNQIDSDPIVADQMRENFISYSQVMQDGRFKIQDYLNAVKYVSFKLMGMSNEDAYVKTFPARYQALVAAGTEEQLSSYVSMYKKGKLVNLIMEQSLVPSWVLNQEAYQKAINTQVDLMANARSEMVRSQAANSLLTHLAKPEKAGPLIAIDVRESGALTELKETMLKLARQQQELINAGVTTKQIAEQRIIDVEATEAK